MTESVRHQSISSTRSSSRLTPSPEVLRCGPGTAMIDHAHRTATAFAVLRDSVVAMARRSTHTFIFNALRAVGKPDAAPPITQRLLQRRGAEGVYEEFGVSFYPRLPSPEDLAWFVQYSPRELGHWRALTKAGRAWVKISIAGQKGSAISWWVARDEVPEATVILVTTALTISGPCFVEFDDSEAPESRVF